VVWRLGRLPFRHPCRGAGAGGVGFPGVAARNSEQRRNRPATVHDPRGVGLDRGAIEPSGWAFSVTDHGDGGERCEGGIHGRGRPCHLFDIGDRVHVCLNAIAGGRIIKGEEMERAECAGACRHTPVRANRCIEGLGA